MNHDEMTMTLEDSFMVIPSRLDKLDDENLRHFIFSIVWNVAKKSKSEFEFQERTSLIFALRYSMRKI